MADLKFGSKVGECYVWQIRLASRMRKEIEDRENTLGDLLSSIQDEKQGAGLIHPLVVVELEEPDGDFLYELLGGGRRDAALLLGGVTSLIPIRIYPADLTERDRERIEIYENTKRKSFTWQEALAAKERLHSFMVEEFGERKTRHADSDDPSKVGWSKNDTANVLGSDRGQLSKDLDLASAIKAIPALAQLKTKDEASKVWKKLVKEVETAEAVKQIEALRSTRSEDAWLKTLAESYILNDFFEGVAKLPDASCDFAEVDPPYSLRELNPYVYESDHTKQFEDVTEAEYPAFIRRVAKECYRLLRQDSWIICWFAQHPHGPVTYDALIEAGFQGMRLPAIWDKQVEAARVIYPDYYLGRATEQFFYLRKGAPKIQKQGHIDIFRHKPPLASERAHTTEKPITLMREILDVFLPPGKTILVPFLGSGNTILAAHNHRSSAFGFDKSEVHRNDFLAKLYRKEWQT